MELTWPGAWWASPPSPGFSPVVCGKENESRSVESPDYLTLRDKENTNVSVALNREKHNIEQGPAKRCNGMRLAKKSWETKPYN